MCILIFEVVIDDEINIFSTFAPCKTMRNVKLQNQQIRAICLLILFLGYQLSVSAFTHLHIIDGVSVVHSHPFQKSHNHSDAEFLILGSVSPLSGLKTDSYVLTAPWFDLQVEKTFAEFSSPLQPMALRVLSLRAPPVVLC